jgi:hypothetical protein
MIYIKGQSWYESPKRPHVISMNGSETEQPDFWCLPRLKRERPAKIR